VDVERRQSRLISRYLSGWAEESHGMSHSVYLTFRPGTSQIQVTRVTATSTLISGFRRDVDEIGAVLGYYAASCGNCLPKFRDNVSFPFSRVKESK
jgi:hypothetical protein